MNALPRAYPRPTSAALLIEGYASLFGVADQSGDIVRAGAFARSLRQSDVPMLLQHQPGAVIGRWSRLIEDGRGLFVRGLINAQTAIDLARGGLDGLSIGFRPLVWSPRATGGRLLADVALVEISLVAAPMLAQARFQIV